MVPSQYYKILQNSELSSLLRTWRVEFERPHAWTRNSQIFCMLFPLKLLACLTALQLTYVSWAQQEVRICWSFHILHLDASTVWNQKMARSTGKFLCQSLLRIERWQPCICPRICSEALIDAHASPLDRLIREDCAAAWIRENVLGS